MSQSHSKVLKLVAILQGQAHHSWLYLGFQGKPKSGVILKFMLIIRLILAPVASTLILSCMTYWNGPAKIADMRSSHFRTDQFSTVSSEFIMLIHAGQLQKVTKMISLVPRLSSMGRKKKSLVHTVCAQFLRTSGNSEISIKSAWLH